jgi:hypothetical protein
VKSTDGFVLFTDEKNISMATLMYLTACGSCLERGSCRGWGDAVTPSQWMIALVRSCIACVVSCSFARFPTAPPRNTLSYNQSTFIFLHYCLIISRQTRNFKKTIPYFREEHLLNIFMTARRPKSRGIQRTSTSPEQLKLRATPGRKSTYIRRVFASRVRRFSHSQRGLTA